MRIIVEQARRPGSDKDEWAARLSMVGEGCRLELSAYGESRSYARMALAALTARICRDIGEVAAELQRN